LAATAAQEKYTSRGTPPKQAASYELLAASQVVGSFAFSALSRTFCWL